MHISSKPVDTMILRKSAADAVILDVYIYVAAHGHVMHTILLPLHNCRTSLAEMHFSNNSSHVTSTSYLVYSRYVCTQPDIGMADRHT